LGLFRAARNGIATNQVSTACKTNTNYRLCYSTCGSLRWRICA
jgi:hypothetical protein